VCEFALGTVCTTVEKLLGNGAVEDEIAVVESTCISVKNGEAKKNRRLARLLLGSF